MSLALFVRVAARVRVRSGFGLALVLLVAGCGGNAATTADRPTTAEGPAKGKTIGVSLLTIVSLTKSGMAVHDIAKAAADYLQKSMLQSS